MILMNYLFYKALIQAIVQWYSFLFFCSRFNCLFYKCKVEHNTIYWYNRIQLLTQNEQTRKESNYPQGQYPCKISEVRFDASSKNGPISTTENHNNGYISTYYFHSQITLVFLYAVVFKGWQWFCLWFLWR
jgi:hypothetical protein